MPILWRYLLKSYFQVFVLCVSGFISLLLVTRFQEIARFTTSGAPVWTIIQFTGYQIPYILPIAIPISCLIAAMLLYQRLSHSHELTAFRSGGLSLLSLAFPLILASSFLTLLNFSIVSEFAPRCRALSRNLIYEMTEKNPLFLLQKETLVKLKDVHIDLKSLKSGQCAEDVILVVNNASNNRLGLMIAKELYLEGEYLTGKNVSFISSADPKKEGFDHLVIENQKTMFTKASNLAQMMRGKEWHSNYEYYPLRLILAREKLQGSFSLSSFGKAHIEIARRMSYALAAFTFTFIGIAFGMEIGRRHTKKGIIWAIALAAGFMVCFLSAKSMRGSSFYACMLYLLPHPIIVILALRSMRRVTEGVE